MNFSINVTEILIFLTPLQFRMGSYLWTTLLRFKLFTDLGGLFLTAGFGVAKGRSGEASLFLFHAGSVMEV